MPLAAFSLYEGAHSIQAGQFTTSALTDSMSFATRPAESPSGSMPTASSNQSRRLRHEPSQPSSNPKEGTSFSVTPPKSSKNLPGSPSPPKAALTFSR